MFTFDSTMEMAVLEEGMEHAGEIHRLADMTRPEVAIITNVGISHLENLGSREIFTERRWRLPISSAEIMS